MSNPPTMATRGLLTLLRVTHVDPHARVRQNNPDAYELRRSPTSGGGRQTADQPQPLRRQPMHVIFDVSFYDPLVRAGREVVHLSHRVMGRAVRAEPVGTREEVRLEDRLQHQLQGRLDHPVGHGRDPQPALLLATRLRDHPLPHRHRSEAAVFQLPPQLAEEPLDTPHGLHVVGGLAIHAGRLGALVVPHPIPRHQKERRVGDKVVQIVEPAVRIVVCPPVQLGLDLQYPPLGLTQQGPLPRRFVSVHQRSPSIPIPALLTCWPPWPCGRLSRPPWRVATPATTTGPPPRPDAIGRRRSYPDTPTRIAGAPEQPGTVPAFTRNRSISLVSSSTPAALPTATPQTFTVASPPTSQPGFGVDPRHPAGVTRCIPAHIHQVGAGDTLTELQTLMSSRTPSDPRQPDPNRLAVPARPGIVGAACHPPQRLLGRAAPSFYPVAATTRREGLAPPSVTSASRRTATSCRNTCPTRQSEYAACCTTSCPHSGRCPASTPRRWSHRPRWRWPPSTPNAAAPQS